MNHIDRILLLHKRLTGRITGAEQRALDHLMKSGDKQEKENEVISRIWEASGKYPNQFQPDVDKAWNSFQTKMAAQPVPMRRSRRSAWIPRVAATLVLLVSAWFGWQYFNSNSISYATVYTGSGEQEQVVLSDGSSVRLGENSMIRYPETFKGDTRQVELNGMAFFEVQPDPQHPFQIQANLGQIEVLGTSFLVRSYPAEQVEEVLVKTGRVAYQIPGQEALILTVGDKAIARTDNPLAQRIQDASFNDLAWFTGEFQFSNTPLTEVLHTL
ncbi:MAG: FecR domain-containing protein, partial [Saprospiraceae bacterium]|nr:FecR domain-containing protein [Saprospiraceae bacterium]